MIFSEIQRERAAEMWAQPRPAPYVAPPPPPPPPFVPAPAPGNQFAIAFIRDYNALPDSLRNDYYTADDGSTFTITPKPYVTIWGQQIGLDNNYNYAIYPNGAIHYIFFGYDPYYNPDTDFSMTGDTHQAIKTTVDLFRDYGWNPNNAVRDDHGYPIPGDIAGLRFVPYTNPGQHGGSFFWDTLLPGAVFSLLTFGVGAAAGVAEVVADAATVAETVSTTAPALVETAATVAPAVETTATVAPAVVETTATIAPEISVAATLPDIPIDITASTLDTASTATITAASEPLPVGQFDDLSFASDVSDFSPMDVVPMNEVPEAADTVMDAGSGVADTPQYEPDFPVDPQAGAPAYEPDFPVDPNAGTPAYEPDFPVDPNAGADEQIITKELVNRGLDPNNAALRAVGKSILESVYRQETHRGATPAQATRRAQAQVRAAYAAQAARRPVRRAPSAASILAPGFPTDPFATDPAGVDPFGCAPGGECPPKKNGAVILGALALLYVLSQ